VYRFQSRCRKEETVEVRRMAPEDACSGDMLVLIRWQSRSLSVPLSQLAAINASESTVEAIGDCHYWLTQGYTLWIAVASRQACRKFIIGIVSTLELLQHHLA
jgi:hypothetical protein